MTSEMIYETIHNTVLSLLPDARILLFGSRAKGTADKHSDYDLLVITPNELTKKERITWSAQLNKAIVAGIDAPVDLLLYSEDEINRKQQLPGHIVRSAVREGVAI